jgi:ABC-type Na+ efflux pump permease subunit
MKVQIARFSPHQNGKVFGVLMALGSLVFVIPMVALSSLMPAVTDAQGNPIPQPPVMLFLLFPVIYLVMGYIMVAIGCAIYNFMFRFIGGIEYESEGR